MGEKSSPIKATPCLTASSLTTAAGRAAVSPPCGLVLRSSNCRRQRWSLILDSHQVSRVPISVRRAPSLTGTRRSPCLPKRRTASSGACLWNSGSMGTSCPAASSTRVSELNRRKERAGWRPVAVIAIDFEGSALFGAARNQTDGGFGSDADVVGARKTAAHEDACAGGADVGVIGGAARDGEVEIAIFEDLGALAIPVFEDVGDALAADFGDEEAAVEEDGVGDLPGGFEERGQVPGDGGIGHVRQAEFAEEAALLFLGSVPRSVSGRKPSRVSSRASARRISVSSVPPISEEPPPRTVISTLGKRGSLSRRSLAAEHWRRRPLRWRMESGEPSLVLDQPGEGEVEVIAAKQEVLADGGAGELDAVVLAADADEGEVAGAAADVADQHGLSVKELLAGLGEIAGDPGVEGGGGFLEQRELWDAGFASGQDGEFAGLFIEGCGDGEDNVLGGHCGAAGLLPFFAELG